MVLKAFDDGFIFVLTTSVRFSYIRDKNQFKQKQDKKQQLGVTNETGTAYTCLRGIRVVQSLVCCVVFCTLVYHCLSFLAFILFVSRLLITPLVSSNVSSFIALQKSLLCDISQSWSASLGHPSTCILYKQYN